MAGNANNKKLVTEITAMDEDFAKWYTDIVKKADLIDYSSVKGCMIIRPYGYAIWENIQKILDKKFKDEGHENVYMPMFIPESLLNKEKDHPEMGWSFSWRSRRDSNSRASYPAYTLSRGASSPT